MKRGFVQGSRPNRRRFSDLNEAIEVWTSAVFWSGETVPVEKWHGVLTEGKPDLQSIELLDCHFSAPMPNGIYESQGVIKPNLPWAEDHFQERVFGDPINPGEQYKNWPWYREGSEWDNQFRKDGKFTHTYMERLWSKPMGYDRPGPMGVRYKFGNLEDVVSLLLNYPLTRQAFVPIWFPEDTGAVHEGRVPCTIGYHFMIRKRKLQLWYTIRSCDVVRYLRDDIYMAVRLAHWVVDNLANDEKDIPDFGYELGDLHFHAFSLHAFEGDRYGPTA